MVAASACCADPENVSPAAAAVAVARMAAASRHRANSNITVLLPHDDHAARTRLHTDLYGLEPRVPAGSMVEKYSWLCSMTSLPFRATSTRSSSLCSIVASPLSLPLPLSGPLFASLIEAQRSVDHRCRSHRFLWHTN